MGMWLHDLNVHWMNHPFVRNQFVIADDAAFVQIMATGVRKVYIDTVRDLDMPDAPTIISTKAFFKKTPKIDQIHSKYTPFRPSFYF